MVETKASFIARALDHARRISNENLAETHAITDDFQENGSEWHLRLSYLPPDAHPEIFVKCKANKTTWKAWVYPADGFKIQVY